MPSPATGLSNEALDRMLLQSVVDYAIYMISPEGDVLTWNAGAELVKGYSAMDVVGRNFELFYTAHDRAAGAPRSALANALSAGAYKGSGWRVRKNGSLFWAQVIIAPVFDDEARLVGFAKTTRDLTENKRQVETIQQMSASLELALSSMSHGLALFDAQERVCLWNTRWLQLTKSSMTLGDTYAEFVRQGLMREGMAAAEASARSIEDRELHIDRIRRADGDGAAFVEERRSKDGVLLYSFRPTPDGGFVCTVDDVTERRQLEERATFLAQHDALTGLPNRAMVDQASKRSNGIGGLNAGSALLCMEVDRFKTIIDACGHAAADAVLKAVADRIRKSLRQDDVATRLGGDEFVILAANCFDVDQANGLASRLIASIQKPIAVGDTSVFIKVNVGIALYSADQSDFAALLGNARLALHAQQRTGSTGHSLYDPGMGSSRRDRSILEQELHDAITRNDFELRFQPIVNAGSHMPSSFEALLRWTSPTQGPLSPAVFVPIAEEIGLACEIDEWVLDAACREALKWVGALVVSVNLSASQLRKRGLADRIAAILANTGLPAHRLEVEITETTYIHDLAFAKSVVSEVRALGVQIALDDIGTGYSSLSLLLALSFTRVKIDRSFVKDLSTNAQSRAIVQAICGLCEKLGVESTAEGVETADHAQWLHANGCTHLQGYFFGRPLATNSIPAWVEGRQAVEAASAPHLRRLVAQTAL